MLDLLLQRQDFTYFTPLIHTESWSCSYEEMPGKSEASKHAYLSRLVKAARHSRHSKHTELSTASPHAIGHALVIHPNGVRHPPASQYGHYHVTESKLNHKGGAKHTVSVSLVPLAL